MTLLTSSPAAASRTRRALIATAFGALTLVALVILSAGLGLVSISPLDTVRALLFRAGVDPQHSAVIWTIRAPRIVVAALVGAALAACGTTLQAVFRNPLADPGVTGVSSGAAVGAVAGITLGLAGSLSWGVPLAAFCGALVVTGILHLAMRSVPNGGGATLILVGVSINAFAGAIISILIANAENDALARGAMFWLSGDLELRDWGHVLLALVPIVIGTTFLLTRGRHLDALTLGDDVAHTSGIDTGRTRLSLLLATSLVTGAAVSVSGIIGFVGLVVPHAVRLIIGSKHSYLMPISMLAGSVFLVAADTVARSAFGLTAIQTGAVCALVGAPVFLALLLRRRA